MPEPREGETRDEWIDRCMGDSESVSDFPDADQRFAFCQSRWEESQKTMPDNSMEHKFFQFKTESVDLEESRFEGFGAAIGNKDLGNDIIEPGAFTKTINERVAAGKVKFLDNHNGHTTRNVWGTVASAKEVPVDQKGSNAPSHKLFTRFDVSPSDPDAQIALRKIKEGHLDQLSIGFEPITVEFTKKEDSDFDDPRTAWIMGQGTRHIKEIKLWEVSLVIWAMNPEATILGNSLKSLTNFAQRVNEKGHEVPEDAVKEAILALNSILGREAGTVEEQAAIVAAMDEVKFAVDNVCEVASSKTDPVVSLISEWETSTGNELSADFSGFKVWVGDRVDTTVFTGNDEKSADDGSEEDEDCGCGKSKDEYMKDAVEDAQDDIEDRVEEKSDEVEDEKEDSADPDTEEKSDDDSEVDGEAENKSEGNELASAIGKLSEAIDNLKKEMAGAEDSDVEDSKDQDADPDETKTDSETHTEEEVEEAAKDTDDGRSKHFPDQDEIAAELERLRLLELETEFN